MTAGARGNPEKRARRGRGPASRCAMTRREHRDRSECDQCWAVSGLGREAESGGSDGDDGEGRHWRSDTVLEKEILMPVGEGANQPGQD